MARLPVDRYSSAAALAAKGTGDTQLANHLRMVGADEQAMPSKTVDVVNIAIIGATGIVDTRMLSESLDRKYEVTAIVPNTQKLPTRLKLQSA